MTTHFAITDSPIGELLVLGDEEKVHGLLMNGDGAFDQRKLVLTQEQDVFADTIDQLDEYFAGERDSFDLRLEPNGTEFQRAVWNALGQIPYG